MLRSLKKGIVKIIDWLLHAVLTDKQKRFIAGLIPAKQKESLKKNVEKYGTIHAQQHQMQQIKYHLYSLGFHKKGLFELEAFYARSKDATIKRKIAWELALWHTNAYTKDDAEQALPYLDDASLGEKDTDQLRRIAIIRAECYERIGHIDQAHEVIERALEEEKHPDLYLAAANLETSIDARLQWLNKVFSSYALQPIAFSETNPTYDDLHTVAFDRKIEDGPKVSVILPAYNAGDGIRIAIESILSQTWQNIELLVVDDCSTDNTVDIVKSYIEEDARVKLFSTPKNSGPYVARNIALQAATGEYVTVNDADDWSHAEKIEIQATYLNNHPAIISNTSEHARLTEEDLKLYRRGTPGKYIFPNMSSIMFRRKQVLDALGYWDSVRFAADGEFKRRLLRAFGKQAIVDVETGPLSLPRQSVSSLTGSSAFGYNGFFMGARKEYVESLEYHHDHTNDYVYPYPMETRPFPVPEPMWPEREIEKGAQRQFDMVICADFRLLDLTSSEMYPAIQAHIQKNKHIGLIQMYHFDLTLDTVDIKPEVRRLLDNPNVHMLVYGEKIATKQLFIMHHTILEDEQLYVPDVDADAIHVIVDPETKKQPTEAMCDHMTHYFGKMGTWYTTGETDETMLKSQTQVSKISALNKMWENMVHETE